MREPAYFKALNIVVPDFYLRDDGFVDSVRGHFRQVYKELTGKYFEDWEVKMTTNLLDDSAGSVVIRSGREELEYATGVCIPLPFKSYAEMSFTELVRGDYQPTGALIFYQKKNIPEANLFVRAHEEGHALHIAGRVHLLSDKLRKIGMSGLSSEPFMHLLKQYLYDDNEPVPENSCQELSPKLLRRLEIMEQANPSLFLIEESNYRGVDFQTNQPIYKPLHELFFSV